MGRKKGQSITQANSVLFTVTREDVEPLAYFETKLMRQNFKDDCLKVPDAEILRHALHLAYDAEKKNSNVKRQKNA